MRQFRLISVVLAIIFASISYAQTNENLILQYWGGKDDPYKQTFLDLCKTSNDRNYNEEVYSKYYAENRNDILRKIDENAFIDVINDGGYVEKVIKKAEKYAMIFEAIPVVLEAGMQGYTQAKALQAQEKAIEAERQAQLRAEQQVRSAQNKQKYADFQTMTNRKVYSSDNRSVNSDFIGQGSYNDLLTSDPNWNAQVQMWVQQYGVEKTREIVKQQRSNDYQQSIQVSNIYSQNQTGGERVVFAVTSSRQQIKIKIRGNSIVAYSTGVNQLGKQEWISVLPSVGFSKTGPGTLYDSGSLSKEFSYAANLNGLQIYFDM